LKVFAIVPVKSFENAKTRLGTFLSTAERVRLSGMLLKRTICILNRTPGIQKILLVSSDNRTKKIALRYGVTFLEEDKESGVNSAINLADKFCVTACADASLILPIDLPLILPEDINIVCKSVLDDDNCIVLCPSYKFDGSNVLLRKPCNIIGTSYDANSYLMHVLEGIRNNVKTKVLFVSRLMIDIDTVRDIRNMLAMNETDNQITRYLKTILIKPHH
jgi:2-phospho-L-lactate/phosphoenolpyruvate guanylyltransferase